MRRRASDRLEALSDVVGCTGTTHVTPIYIYWERCVECSGAHTQVLVAGSVLPGYCTRHVHVRKTNLFYF
jgi:hypothetical protein